MDSLKILILAGGRSSRMGSPKHLLQLFGQPLYVRLIQAICQILTETSQIYISLAPRSIQDDALSNGEVLLSSPSCVQESKVKLVIVLDQTQQDIGPAGGLIAAHHSCPSATWLVVACDFPFLESGTVKQLLDEFETPVTCFRNSEGFSEPLLAIWSPQALVELEKNVESGRKGPNFTVKMLSGKSIIPKKEKWLTNTNTMEEWKDVKSRLEA